MSFRLRAGTIARHPAIPIVLTGLATAAGAAGSALQPYQSQARHSSEASGAAGSLALLATIAQVAQERRRRRMEALDIVGAVEVLHAILSMYAGGVASGQLRMTVHEVEADKFVQLTDYVGGQGGSGRRWSVRSGVVGLAIRQGKEAHSRWDGTDAAAFEADMVQFWGYTRDEARLLSRDRHSWFAVPILHKNGSATAVVYFDSSDPGFFTPDVMAVASEGASAIARFAVARFAG